MTVSRMITALAADLPAVLAAVDSARARPARYGSWPLCAPAPSAAPARWSGCMVSALVRARPDHGADTSRPVVIDLDATLVTAHSDKEQARPTFKRGYGSHPVCVFDHGEAGSGEPLQIMLRPGKAGSNTVTDHVAVTRAALRQLPSYRPGTRRGGRCWSDPTAPAALAASLNGWPGSACPTRSGSTSSSTPPLSSPRSPPWCVDPAYDADGRVRDGAWVAELTGMLDLTDWPRGMRVSCGRNGRTPEPRSGSLMPTRCASPRAPPTPGCTTRTVETSPPNHTRPDCHVITQVRSAARQRAPIQRAKPGALIRPPPRRLTTSEADRPFASSGASEDKQVGLSAGECS
jgi:Transposase DDE domain group 1